MAEQARVYGLVSPALIVGAQDVITQAVFRILGVSDLSLHDLVCSESSGWVNYTAKDEIWVRRYPPALPSADQARQRAEAFIASLAGATSPGAKAWPANLARVSLLPRLMRPVQLSAVPRPDGSAWDHWLYRAQPRLSLDPSGRKSVPVFGSHIEVRIGDRGQVISFSSRWRPLSGERITTDLVAFKPAPHDDAHGNGGTPEPHLSGGEEHPPHVHQPGEEHGPGAAGESPARDQRRHELQYLLDGDRIPQYYLAPFYLTSDGHMLREVSACAYALTMALGRVQGAESMLLTAVARGGSGDYAYNFAVYRLDRIEEGYTELGRGQSVEVETDDGTALMGAVEVPNGAYVVMVNVKDRATGAFKHTQQQVVSTLSADTSTPRAVA